MKIVLAVEGTDGSGKTTMVRFLKKVCEQQNIPISVLGRRGGHTGPTVAKLSQVLDEETKSLAPLSEMALRLTRESERAQLAALVPAGLVVMDRFLLSLFSLARVHGLARDPWEQLLKEVAVRAQLFATVFLHCPFDLAAARVKNRHPQVSLRKKRSEAMLRKQAGYLEEEFQRGTLTGQQWWVDNSGEAEPAQEFLVNLLFPYLFKD